MVGVDNVDVIFLRPEEIPSRVEQGDAHAGMTGEDLYREYGEGAYRCVVYINNELKRTFMRYIGPAPKVVVPKSETSEITLLVETIRAEAQRSQEMLTQVLAAIAKPAPAAPAIDPMAMMTGMITAAYSEPWLLWMVAAYAGTSVSSSPNP